MILGTILCWAMFVLVIFNINPANGAIALLLFYSSLFLSLIGTLAILGSVIRIFLFKKEIIFREVKSSLRQALLFSFLFVVILMLQSKRILAWWNVLFLVVALAAFEGLMVSLGKK
ncbi:hypothetical protein A2Y83_04305 [Candidatus Falkowbacteria bacterium RBG_13_39_14]|uniref:Uncharacterized protein n=1 Tax=Candidatus Falkowbacteria bacterium RBG_13_39_14 TaxID=1797985 RepID=A0A1F5S3G2_9BACT|nr:MAG: hypothetical protein A2Y83_04305 [Candidatus Falkowbacteria bacterium RBG_13_39_14]